MSSTPDDSRHWAKRSDHVDVRRRPSDRDAALFLIQAMIIREPL